MKYVSLLILAFFLVSCSDKNDEQYPQDQMLIGYWAITHIRNIQHNGGVHNTTDMDVPPHGADSYAGDFENNRYDVLIFDEHYVTVSGDMPNRPKGSDFYIDTTDGQIEYMAALQKWKDSIAQFTDQFDCPVGSYTIRNGDLIIGSLNMGKICFISNNEFTLDYKQALSYKGDYRRSIYTYSRIYSLNL